MIDGNRKEGYDYEVNLSDKIGQDMKILIKSRKSIEKQGLLPFYDKIALISITNSDLSFASLLFQPKYLLQLKFNDIDNDIFIDEFGWGVKPTESQRKKIEEKYTMLTDEKAQQIADFYFSIADKVDIIICQCEHGQSRSAAVAAAILEYRAKRGIEIFSNDNYFPNKVVYRKVFKALKGELI